MRNWHAIFGHVQPRWKAIFSPESVCRRRSCFLGGVMGEMLAGSGMSPFSFAGEGVMRSSEHMETSAMVFSGPCEGDRNMPPLLGLVVVDGGRLMDLAISGAGPVPHGESCQPPELPPDMLRSNISGCMV